MNRALLNVYPALISSMSMFHIEISRYVDMSDFINETAALVNSHCSLLISEFDSVHSLV